MVHQKDEILDHLKEGIRRFRKDVYREAASMPQHPHTLLIVKCSANIRSVSGGCRSGAFADTRNGMYEVSPATHPPCIDQNSCVQTIDEIKRGCNLLGQDAPQFCLEYKPR